MTVLELARAGTDVAGVVSVHGSLSTPRPAKPGVVDWQLIAYGSPMHGFTHEDAARFPVPGVAYHAPTDARSWTAIQSFFAELFGPDGSATRNR